MRTQDLSLIFNPLLFLLYSSHGEEQNLRSPGPRSDASRFEKKNEKKILSERLTMKQKYGIFCVPFSPRILPNFFSFHLATQGFNKDALNRHTDIEVIFPGYPPKLVPLWAQIDDEILGSAPVTGIIFGHCGNWV